LTEKPVSLFKRLEELTDEDVDGRGTTFNETM
jgi:hypothetical protein